MPYLFALIAGVVHFLSGWFALIETSRPFQARYIIALATGVLLGATFFHILPELHVERDAPLLALGFMAFYLLEKIMMIHACGEHECETHRIGPIAVFGMALDNIIDGAGIVIGCSISLDLGMAIMLAVLLHEVPQGMTSALIMRGAGWRRGGTLLVVALAGSLYPAGALLAGMISHDFQQRLLAFIAGVFVYIGACDLLPEAHQRFNWKVILLVLSGMVGMLLLRQLH